MALLERLGSDSDQSFVERVAVTLDVLRISGRISEPKSELCIFIIKSSRQSQSMLRHLDNDIVVETAYSWNRVAIRLFVRSMNHWRSAGICKYQHVSSYDRLLCKPMGEAKRSGIQR